MNFLYTVLESYTFNTSNDPITDQHFLDLITETNIINININKSDQSWGKLQYQVQSLGYFK